MDDRFLQQAEVLLDTTLGGVENGDQVAIMAPPESFELIKALYIETAKRQAVPVGVYGHSLYGFGNMEIAGDYMEHHPGDDMETQDHLLELVKASDHIVFVSAFENADEHADIRHSTIRGLRNAYGPILDEVLTRTDAGYTIYPNAAGAQLAGMSTTAFRDYVWDSMLNVDWDEQEAYQEQMVGLINDGSTVEISAENTDMTMAIDGMQAVSDAGREINMPGGEVYTAPVIDSVTGTVTFNSSIVSSLGGVIKNPTMTFEDGELQSFSAAHGEDTLASIVNSDDGARRVGELGIGMNQEMDQTTGRIALDEKIGESIHIALGSAYPDCVGPDRERNESSTHIDFVLGTDRDITVTIDGVDVLNEAGFIFDR